MPSIEQIFASIMPVHGAWGRRRFLSANKEFSRRGLRTARQLSKAYPHLSTGHRFVAIMIFRHVKLKSALSLLFEEFDSNDSHIAGIAPIAAIAVGGKEAANRMIQMVRGSVAGGTRLRILSALASANRFKGRRVIDTLITELELGVSPEARAIAADGLAHHLRGLRRTSKARVRGLSALATSLRDSEPVVRGCAAFAIGELSASEYRDQLRDLSKSDFARCQNLGSVSSIALEALAKLE